MEINGSEKEIHTLLFILMCYCPIHNAISTCIAIVNSITLTHQLGYISAFFQYIFIVVLQVFTLAFGSGEDLGVV